MLGFNYIYQSSQEILSISTHLRDISVSEILSLIAFISLVLIGVFIIIPLVIIIKQNLQDQKQKKIKKKILTQILLQKEIEDEVEGEIQIEDENRIIKN